MIVVTGGSGFIGTNLVRSLLELNHKVLVVEELDRNANKFKNIDTLDIVDCIGHNIFIRDLLNDKYKNKIETKMIKVICGCLIDKKPKNIINFKK